MNSDLAQPGTRLPASPYRKKSGPVIFQPRIVSIILGLILWELLGRLKFSVIIPTFLEAIRAWLNLITSGTLLPQLTVSLLYFALGFAMAVGIGVLLGGMMARYRAVDYTFDLWVNMGMSAPSVAFIPLLIILFGIGDTTRAAVTFIFCFWVIVVNTYTGIRYMDYGLVEMASSFCASERQLFWKIRIPGGLPLITAGLRMGTAMAVKGMVTGEMLITVVGLGAMVMQYSNTFNGPYLFAVLGNIVFVALILTWVMKLSLKRWAYWES